MQACKNLAITEGSSQLCAAVEQTQYSCDYLILDDAGIQGLGNNRGQQPMCAANAQSSTAVADSAFIMQAFHCLAMTESNSQFDAAPSIVQAFRKNLAITEGNSKVSGALYTAEHALITQASKNLAIIEGNSKVSGALYMADHPFIMQASKNLAITEGNSKVSGALYMAGEEHLQLLLDTYNLFSHTNPLHTEVWPSMRQMESDVIAMTAAMLGGTQCRACQHLVAA